MGDFRLFLIVLGGRPAGRNVEQHDVILAVGKELKDCAQAIQKHWDIGVHVDSYMVVNEVDGYDVMISTAPAESPAPVRLYFINLGGYRESDLEEYHKKVVVAAGSIDEAKQKAKQDQFFFQGIQQAEGGARSHVDDKLALFGFAVDDMMVVNNAIDPAYHIILTARSEAAFSHNTAVPGYTLLKQLLEVK